MVQAAKPCSVTVSVRSADTDNSNYIRTPYSYDLHLHRVPWRSWSLTLALQGDLILLFLSLFPPTKYRVFVSYEVPLLNCQPRGFTPLPPTSWYLVVPTNRERPCPRLINRYELGIVTPISLRSTDIIRIRKPNLHGVLLQTQPHALSLESQLKTPTEKDYIVINLDY